MLSAKDNESPFLQSIDEKADTIFNPLQLKQLKQELEHSHSINASLNNEANFRILIKAIEQALSEGDYTYLKIGCSTKINWTSNY